MGTNMRAVSLILLCAVLASCGGASGGSGAVASAPLATAITGIAVDGYIQGATVCLDLNLNQSCDPSEPSATTAAGGTFKLGISGLPTAQVRAAHVLVNVPSSAKDSDDSGQTLAQVGKSAYTLMAPASAYVSADGSSVASTVVSPLTTLISHDMIVGNGTPLTDAQNAVRTRLNLPSSTDLHQDFIANNNFTLHNRAKVIALLIGKAFSGAKLVGSTSDREALFAALTYLQKNASIVQGVVDANTSTTSTSAKVDAALMITGLAPNYPELINEARVSTAGGNADIATIFNNVVYSADCLLENSCSSFTYIRSAVQSGQITFASYQHNGTNWANYVPSAGVSSYLGSSGWTDNQFNSSGLFTIVNSNLALIQSAWNGRIYRVTAKLTDIAGLTPSNIPGSWSKLNLKSLTFAANSNIYLLRSTPVADYYDLWSDRPNTCSPSGGCSLNTYSSIDDLIAAHPSDGASKSTGHLSWSGIIFTFDTAGLTVNGGTVTLWNNSTQTCTKQINGYSCSSAVPTTFTRIGSAPYEIRTINGERILVVLTQSHVDQVGYPIYSARAGVVYRGLFRPAGMTSEPSLYLNRIAMDALIAGWGKSAIPD